MAGPATESTVQSLWRKSVDILETLRVHIDSTQVADDTGKIPVLEDALEGENTVAPLANAAASLRAGMSSLLSPSTARSFLDPVLLEYAKVISDGAATTKFGGAETDPQAILDALYDYLQAQSPPSVIESRGIAFGSMTYPGTTRAPARWPALRWTRTVTRSRR